MFWNVCGERGEPQIQGDSPLLALWVLVEAGSASSRAQYLRQTRLAAVNMTQNANVEVEDGGRHFVLSRDFVSYFMHGREF